MQHAGQVFRVLVADDSAVYRRLVENALSTQQYKVLSAKSGNEALELFAQHRPEIVITDWVMPDISGPELCEKIRHRTAGSYTYLILVTSMSEKENVVKGLAAGADDYLTKPFYSEELLARVGVGRRIVTLQHQLEEQNLLLQEMARTDSLTGLPNRRAIEEWGQRQLRGAERHGFPFWVAIADLDCFKSVNDTYGHDAGDAVLKRFGELMKATTRAADMCGRMGGEEFLLVMTHVERQNVHAVVDRMRKRFEAEKFLFAGKQVSVTCSFGVAGFQGKQAPKLAELIAEADRALYAAKRAGRNRIEIAACQEVH